MTSKTYEGSRSDRDEVSECVTYDSLIEMQDAVISNCLRRRSKTMSSNKPTLVQLKDAIDNLTMRLTALEQHANGHDQTIESTLGRMDVVEAAVANIHELIEEVRAQPEEKAESKAAYLERKAEYASRPFGVRCISTGKVLKSKYTTLEEAAQRAVEVEAQMKRAYEAIRRVATISTHVTNGLDASGIYKTRDLVPSMLTRYNSQKI